ncbi:MAG: hypothetical protein GY854_17135 [Deltaproteobacteria bacterium]|nr:hypothetical protein [Deltaproteobacteria bacterium]
MGVKSILRDDRGIAMTEGVIVIPFFIIIWMGLIFLHGTYIARLEAQVEAHNVAYQGAMIGQCKGAKDGKGNDEKMDTILSDANAGVPEDSDVDLDVIDLAKKGGGDSMFDWSHHIVGATVTASGLPKPLGGPTKKMKGKARLMCNMEPRDGLSDALYNFLKDLF